MMPGLRAARIARTRSTSPRAQRGLPVGPAPQVAARPTTLPTMHRPVWIVIPTYNEAANVDGIVRATVAELERLVPDAHHVLIVDDSSPDGTGEIADRLAESLPAVEVLHRAVKTGLGHAYLAGFDRALRGDAELVIEMDADFSHDPRYLEPLLQAAKAADLVLGSRYVPGGGVADWGFLRRLISRGGGLYARIILGVPIHDLTGGFKCIHRRVLEAIRLETVRAEGYVFQIEVTYRALLAGFRVTEVPIVFRDRSVGTSKMSARIAVEAMWAVPLLRRSAPAALGRREPAANAIGMRDDG
jgi:dolichol-phosphate mannosyltransferase